MNLSASPRRAPSLGTFLNSSPVLHRREGLHLVWFGVFAAIGALIGGLVFTFFLHRAGYGGPLVDTAILAIAVGNWIGARSFHVVALGRKFFRRPGKYLGETGFYVQGGIVGVGVSGALVAAGLGVPAGVLLDGLVLGGLATLAIGRVGCFNYGCCYGRATSRPWGVPYTNTQAKVLRLKPHYHGVPLHPTQLYLAACNAIALAVAVSAARLALPSGALAASFLVYHGVLRRLMERLRDDVHFDDGRNWFTHRIATLTALAGLAVFALHVVLPGGVFGAPHATLEVSMETLGAFFADAPLALASSAVAALLMFLGYGVHGARLGIFAGVRP